MVDIAREAFFTNNFGLAVEVYERIIKEQGPNHSLFLGLADSYARGGHLNRAVEAYRVAYRLGNNIRPEQLSNLISALLGVMEKSVPKTNRRLNIQDIFECAVCKYLWKDPVTTICGHTFCRTCLNKEPILTNCNICHTPLQPSRNSSRKNSVLLQNLIDKWFPLEIHAAQLKTKGNDLFKEHLIKEAIGAYTEAIKLSPNDHLLAGNRSHAYSTIEDYKSALEDANRAIDLRPDWAKGYFRKGIALTGLGKHQEAAYAFLQCLHVDPSVATAKSALAKSLHQILAPHATEDVKAEERQLSLNPSSLAFLLEHTDTEAPPSGSSTIPNVTEDNFSQEILEKLHDSLAQELENARQESDSSGSDSENGTKSMSLPEYDSSSSSSLNQVTSSSSSSSLSSSSEDSDSAPGSPQTSQSPQGQPRSAANAQNQQTNEQSLAKRSVAEEMLKKEDVECTLCFRMLYEPITTSCGHTFCLQCLDRCLDHRPTCPLCKSSLIEIIATQERKTSIVISQILEVYFPEEYGKRKVQHDHEILEMSRMIEEGCREIPVFVCTLAFPAVQCPLHVFEPRYRLMVRQVMAAGTRQFGMCICLEDNEDNFASYGTILEIQEVQYLPDGRSVISTVGGAPFKVLSRGKKDGYHTARVELLRDANIEESERKDLIALCTTVHAESKAWIDSLPQSPRTRIQQHLGVFPELEQDYLSLPNGPSWAWYMVAVLPLDPRAQLTILAMTTLKDRLLAIRRVLQYAKRKQHH